MMQRHNFHLGPEAISLLKGHAKKEGVSMSEVVRRAIASYRPKPKPKGK